MQAEAPTAYAPDLAARLVEDVLGDRLAGMQPGFGQAIASGATLLCESQGVSVQLVPGFFATPPDPAVFSDLTDCSWFPICR